MKTKITYIGNYPRCGEKQESDNESGVDVECCDCSVNAKIQRLD